MVSERGDDSALPVCGEYVATLLAAVQTMASALDSLSTRLQSELAATRPPPARRPPPPAEDVLLEALREENRQLREALESRAIIERAKGMIMAQCHCDEAEAFQLLVDRSRRERRKVRAVAADLVGAAPTASTASTAPSAPSAPSASTAPSAPTPVTRLHPETS